MLYLRPWCIEVIFVYNTYIHCTFLGGSFTSESWPVGSMTTSLQLAQECLKDNEPHEEETTSQQTFDGLESFAQTIESGTTLTTCLQSHLN